MITVVPMAGHGARFMDAGYSMPKPLIPVQDQPMVAWALQSLQSLRPTRLVFIVLSEHEREYGISAILRSYFDTAIVDVLHLDKPTKGQLCTVLTAREIIDADDDILIASCDTHVKSNLNNDIAKRAHDCHGIISVASMPGDRWSFARTDDHGRVVEVAEKVRISEHASTGIYYFSKGREFVQVADEMIRSREKTRGEYYIIPVYQKFIERGWRIDVSVAQEMWDMGTPAALQAFEEYLTVEQE